MHYWYDSYGPPYLIWIGILCSHLTLYITGIIWSPPTCTYGPPHVWSDGPSLPYMEQLSYGLPHVCMVPTACTIWWSPYIIWNRYHMVPHMCIWSPTCKIWFFQDSLGKSPLHVLKNVKINLNNCTSALLIWLLWSPIPYMNRYLMVPPYLIWNRYCMVPSHMYIWSPHMWSVVMSYMTLMVPLPYME